MTQQYLWTTLCVILGVHVIFSNAQTDQCITRADVVMVVDSSSSITWEDQNNWNYLKSFLIELANAFTIAEHQSHLALITFANHAEVDFYLDQYYSNRAVNITLSRLIHRGGETNIAAALRLANTDVLHTSRSDDLAPGNRPGTGDIVFVITDGEANIDVGGVSRAASDLHDDGVTVISIGIKDDVNLAELLTIADNNPDRVFQVFDFFDLSSIVSEVVREACSAILPATDGPITASRPTAPFRTTTEDPLHDSTRTSFRITEGTTTPRVTFPPTTGCEGDATDVVFLMDSSGSIGEENFNVMLDFLGDVVEDLDIESGRVQMGAATFGDDTQLEFHLDRYRNRPQIQVAVEDIRYTRGATNTADALRYVRETMFRASNGMRDSARKLLIIITDGSSVDGEATVEQAKLTRDEGIDIISVGVGDWLSVYELMAMASHPVHENMIQVDSFNSLNRITRTIRNAVCGNSRDCESRPCENSASCTLGVQSYMCNCRETFAGQDCDKRCNNGGDIVFAIDASGSVREPNFRKILDFITTVVENLDIDNGADSRNGGSRVGLLVFADDAEVIFHLNSYRTRKDILSAISVRYTGGTTNMAEAFRIARDTMFRSDRGDREDVQDFLVLVTDGKSDDPENTWEEAMATRQQGIHVMTVGIGSGIRDSELRSVSSGVQGHSIHKVEDYDDLEDIVERLVDGLCNNVDECEESRRNPCLNEGQCEDLIYEYACTPCRPYATGARCDRECSGEIDLIIAIDKSGSIRRSRFPLVLEFLAGFLAELDIHSTRTRVGVAAFADDAEVVFQLNTYDNKNDVIKALLRVLYTGGKTNTAAVLQLVSEQMFRRNNGDRESAQNYLMLLTDGNSNINPENTIPQAIRDRNDGIHIILGSVGLDLNNLEIEGIASEPYTSNTFSVESIRFLPDLHDRFVASLCDDVDECTMNGRNPCQNRGRCLDLLNRYQCLCDGGFTGYNCERRCNRQFDVALVLDISGSVEDKYRMTRDMARQIVYGLDVPSGRVRIATVAYSTDIVDQFYLNTYQETEEVINALNFHRKGGQTNTQAALRLVRTEFFTSEHGDRSGVTDIVIVISDGYSNVNDDNTVREADLLKRDGINVYTVALGDSPHFSEMNDISSDPDSEYAYYVGSLNDIEDVASELLDNLCQQ